MLRALDVLAACTSLASHVIHAGSIDSRDDAAPIPLVFCIDVEPDARLIREPVEWLGFDATRGFLEEQRLPIEQATGSPARFCWFLRLDPQITGCYGSATWVFERYAAVIDNLQRNGDHFGIHPHAYRWLEDRQIWLHDFANQAWMEHCVASSLEAFEQGLGTACRSMRFGDRWLSTETVNCSERLGIRYDLTVEPGSPRRETPMRGEPATGFLPDYYRVPRMPYVPDQRDFRRSSAGPRGVRLIPLTSSALAGIPLRRRISRLLRNGVRNRRQATPLAFWSDWSPPNAFTQLLDRALAAQVNPYLVFAIRSSIGARADRRRAVENNLRDLLAHSQAGRFFFCSPGELLDMWDANRQR